MSGENTKSSKKRIVLSIFTLVIIVALVVAVFIIKNKVNTYSLELQSSLNENLKTLQEHSGEYSFEFTPVKCTSGITITCELKNFSLSDKYLNLTGKDTLLSIKPSINKIKFDISSNLNTSVRLFDSNTSDIIVEKMNCSNEVELAGEHSYVIGKVTCDGKINNVITEVENTFYAVHDEFRNNSVSEFAENIIANDNFLLQLIKEVQYVVTDGKYSFSSKNLSQDMDGISAAVLGSSFSEKQYTQNDFDKLRKIVNKYSLKEFTMFKDGIDALENIYINNANTLNIDIKLNETVDNAVSSKMYPSFYDIHIKSR